jgi:hypothetical protein
MAKHMTRWGVGPSWALAWVTYIIAACILTDVYPDFRIPDAFYPAFKYLGFFLLLIGLPYYVLSVYAVMKAYSAGELVTKGVYSICRHPIYSSAVIFNVPGFALLVHSWLAMTAPIFMYLMLRILIRKEEDFLADKFGERYLEYKSEVPFVCPVGWLARKRRKK